MAYKNGYAIGAFNVNNMEIVQGITEACKEEKAPVILQVSKALDIKLHIFARDGNNLLLDFLHLRSQVIIFYFCHIFYFS